MTETHDPIRFVTTGQPATATAAEMCEAIKAAVYAYADRVPLALAIGVIEIAKAEIMAEVSR